MEKQILKTGYEWCLEANIRLLKLSDWDTDSNEHPFMSNHTMKKK